MLSIEFVKLMSLPSRTWRFLKSATEVLMRTREQKELFLEFFGQHMFPRLRTTASTIHSPSSTLLPFKKVPKASIAFNKFLHLRNTNFDCNHVNLLKSRSFSINTHSFNTMSQTNWNTKTVIAKLQETVPLK